MDMVGLIPQFGGALFTILAFVAALTIIVFIHEYGHYIIGRWSGIRAEVFSIGIGPVLWSRLDKRGTKWQIAAFPVGGFVKFLGDANAASAGVDGEVLQGLSDAERRASMPGAPLWARASTVAAGPVFNFILSIVIFAGFALSQGVATDPLTVARLPDMPGLENGLKPGDEILAINGVATPGLAGFAEYVAQLPEQKTLPYTVGRDGETVDVLAPHPYPPLVGAVSPGSAALDAGLEAGDVILSMDGQEVATFAQMRDVVGQSGGRALALRVWRPDQDGGQEMDFTLVPRKIDLPLAEGGFETRWLIGVSAQFLFEPASRNLGPLEAVKAGVRQTAYIISASVSGLYHMIAGNISSCNLRGPIGIAQTSGQAAAQGPSDFIWFIGVLSTAVGFLNLFPIPILDGGHLAFFAYEAVARRKPSDRALNILMGIGLVLVLSLMVFGLTNDLRCP